jgi:hypothetical protein
MLVFMNIMYVNVPYDYLFMCLPLSDGSLLLCVIMTACSKSKSKAHYDRRSESASSSWCLAPFGASDQMLHLFE